MPSQPRSPSLRENAGSTPDSQVSTCVLKVPAASSAARNSRTSARTASAASEDGAGASVSGLLIPRFYRDAAGRRSPGSLLGGVTRRRAAGQLPELGDHLAGHRAEGGQRARHQPADPGEVQPEPGPDPDRGLEP